MSIPNSWRVFSLYISILLFNFFSTQAQKPKINWEPNGDQYYRAVGGEILKFDPNNPTHKTSILTRENLTPPGAGSPLLVSNFTITDDENRVLIFTNTKRVWRYNTRGDYWIFDKITQSLKQLGKSLEPASLMFAKLSPDGNQVAYVSNHNLYVEDWANGIIKPLTQDGAKKLINGTFDWAYEEEFDCRDGFRWSPNGKSIAFWQIDARTIKNYLMLNTTDSIYPFTIPVEYPVAGEDPSSCRIGVVNIESGKTTWMNVPGDPIQHYIPRMEWANNSDEIILEQLNRAQNDSRIYLTQIQNGQSRLIHEEKDNAWIDVKTRWSDGDPTGWEWLKDGKSFLWISEKDGWRHIYSINRDGKEKLLSPGNYDLIGLKRLDESTGFIYFTASPDNATQTYLFRIKLSGGKPERMTPLEEPGTHNYEISPNGKLALHTFSNIFTPPQGEVVSIPEHKHLSGNPIKINNDLVNKPEFFKVKTIDGVELDGWMVKPIPFDPNKKYPVVFFVYGEPASSTVLDSYGTSNNREYLGNMATDGYLYVSLDNRGTPSPKGAAWRKAIYKNIGIVNIEDQAMGAKEVLKFPFVDTSRVAVWGWSGGGSSTLNLMFQHPEIYKTGIAIAAVGWQLSYDNIYQERYMGVPTNDEGRSYFIKGSPVTYAKNLKGNLLYIHGSGDDNVHYKNAELLINELIKYNKQFQMMEYPNRSHGIFEGEGTSTHLRTLFTLYLKEHCIPGGR